MLTIARALVLTANADNSFIEALKAGVSTLANVLWFVAKRSAAARKSFFFCTIHSKKRASKNAVNNWQITRIEENGSALLGDGIIPIKSTDRPICEQKTGNMLPAN